MRTAARVLAALAVLAAVGIVLQLAAGIGVVFHVGQWELPLSYLAAVGLALAARCCHEAAVRRRSPRRYRSLPAAVRASTTGEVAGRELVAADPGRDTTPAITATPGGTR